MSKKIISVGPAMDPIVKRKRPCLLIDGQPLIWLDDKSENSLKIKLKKMIEFEDEINKNPELYGFFNYEFAPSVKKYLSLNNS